MVLVCSEPICVESWAKGEKYAKEAKFTIQQARQIALKARPGSITDEELERESGGSGLRYLFDVKSRNKTYEVGVDAKTGKVLEVSVDGPGRRLGCR
jgi:uncharacterized membrane protein YkoI